MTDHDSDTREPVCNGQLTDPFALTVLNSLSAHIAIIDENGVILATNQAWRQYGAGAGSGGGGDSAGANYLSVCDAAAAGGDRDARTVADGIRRVMAGEIPEFLHDYPCHSPDGRHWYYMRVIRVSGPGALRLVISHEEITALKLAEEALRERERELEQQAQSLEEANIALKVLLKQREADKAELEQKVLSNVRELVLPYVEKLKGARLPPREKTLAGIVESHLNDIVSPFLQRMSTARSILTPQEIQVAALVKEGKSSKDIAGILNISVTTVNFHRKNLRIKFGLANRSVNLRSHLLTLT